MTGVDAEENNGLIRRLRRRRKVFAWAVVLTSMISNLLLWQLLERYFHADRWTAQWVSYCVTAVPLFVLMKTTDAWFWPSDPGAERRMARIEQEHAQRRGLWVAVGITVVQVTWVISCVTGAAHPETLRAQSAPWFVALFGLLYVPWFLGGGYAKKWRAVMNDELTRFLRARALSIGYAVVVVATVTVYVGSLYFPNAASMGLPVIILLSVAVPMIAFAWFERRAGGVD